MSLPLSVRLARTWIAGSLSKPSTRAALTEPNLRAIASDLFGADREMACRVLEALLDEADERGALFVVATKPRLEVKP